MLVVIAKMTPTAASQKMSPGRAPRLGDTMRFITCFELGRREQRVALGPPIGITLFHIFGHSLEPFRELE